MSRRGGLSRWGTQVMRLIGVTVEEILSSSGARVALGLTAAACGSGWFWRGFNFGADEARFLVDFGGAVQALIGVALMVVGLAQTLFAEVERGTAVVLLAGKVSRSAWLVGKWAGVLLVATIWVVGSSAWLALVMRWANVEVAAWGHVLIVSGVALILKLALVGVFVLWFASCSRSLVFVVLASVMVVVAGQLRFLVPDDAAFAFWLSRMVPNLHQFAMGASVWEVMEKGGSVVTELGRLALYTGGYVVVLVGLSAEAWRRREF